jgi:hypothetical protein
LVWHQVLAASATKASSRSGYRGAPHGLRSYLEAVEGSKASASGSDLPRPFPSSRSSRGPHLAGSGSQLSALYVRLADARAIRGTIRAARRTRPSEWLCPIRQHRARSRRASPRRRQTRPPRGVANAVMVRPRASSAISSRPVQVGDASPHRRAADLRGELLAVLFDVWRGLDLLFGHRYLQVIGSYRDPAQQHVGQMTADETLVDGGELHGSSVAGNEIVRDVALRCLAGGALRESLHRSGEVACTSTLFTPGRSSSRSPQRWTTAPKPRDCCAAA